MKIKEFNNLEEVQEYYNKETHTYAFIENDEYINLVIFNFDLNLDANIEAQHIYAVNINARDIKAWNVIASDINARNIYGWDIEAHNIQAGCIDVDNIKAKDIDVEDIHAHTIYANNIKADNILYFSVCFANKNIKCKSIKGFRKNHKHFVLDGELEVEEEN